MNMHKKQLAITATLVGGMVFAGVAGATPYVVTLTQQGSNVVAIGSGNIDLTDLHFDYAESGPPNLAPYGFEFVIGNSFYGFALFSGTIFTGISGPGNFGSGDITFASSATGDAVGVLPGGVIPGDIGVPFGYTSDTALSSSATFDNATFASLGVRPGTYVETWGTGGADQRITLDIIPSAVGVPEPAELGLFGLGLVLIGGFAGLRRRKA